MKFAMHWIVALLVGLGVTSLAQATETLEGRIWDVHAQQFIALDVMFQRAASARYVLLGEKHDSEAHRARQLDLLQALAQRGRSPALAMEQFDSEYQSALAAAQGAGVIDADALADAGQLNRKGWRWPMYRDLIAFAGTQRWPLLAANLSRAEARKIALGEVVPDIPVATHLQQTGLEDDVVQGHCGYRPETARLAGIVAAQRARDARMAEVLDSTPGQVVLIAGAGHVRADRAVPRYLAQPTQALAVALVEALPGYSALSDYDSAGFDLLWFTAAQPRSDACAKPLPGLAAPAVVTLTTVPAAAKATP
ncbi:MAG: ChaN family lipoprotein [Rhodoferax sp.]|nr:ChaN family lipoprotein [Rhodoferax sp.]